VGALSESFEERLQEIDAYLDLLEAIERVVRDGPPKVGDTVITTQQQRILYSSVYLQLYNLVEATVTWCMDAVSAAAAQDGRWLPGDLTDHLRREWVRTTARTHVQLNDEHRLQSAIELCDRLVQALPVIAWKLDRRGAGSWDDNQIEEITERLGCELHLSAEVYSGIKRTIRDDKPPLVLIKDIRNRLAHGSLSFAECGDGHTVLDLREIKQRTALYLREVVAAFQAFIDAHEFIIPARRPATQA
jgi:hypothetical protein